MFHVTVNRRNIMKVSSRKPLIRFLWYFKRCENNLQLLCFIIIARETTEPKNWNVAPLLVGSVSQIYVPDNCMQRVFWHDFEQRIHKHKIFVK